MSALGVSRDIRLDPGLFRPQTAHAATNIGRRRASGSGVRSTPLKMKACTLVAVQPRDRAKKQWQG